MCDNCTQAYVRRNQISTGDPGKRRLETDVIMYHQYSSSVCRILVCSICMTSEAGRWRQRIRSQRQCGLDSCDFSQDGVAASAIDWMQSAAYKSMIRSSIRRHACGPKSKPSREDCQKNVERSNVCCGRVGAILSGRTVPLLFWATCPIIITVLLWLSVRKPNTLQYTRQATGRENFIITYHGPDY